MDKIRAEKEEAGAAVLQSSSNKQLLLLYMLGRLAGAGPARLASKSQKALTDV